MSDIKNIFFDLLSNNRPFVCSPCIQKTRRKFHPGSCRKTLYQTGAGIIISLFILVPGISSNAAIYRYQDSNGHVYLTDSPASDHYRGSAAYELLLPDRAPLKDKETRHRDKSGKMINSLLTIAQQKQIPSALLMAVIKVESNFNPRAVSPVGAKGLMQLMPGVCKDYGVTDPFDIVQNIRAGAGYLRKMIDRFNNLELALAAYNAGPGAVEKYDGVPPYSETQNYIKKIYTHLKRYYVSDK